MVWQVDCPTRELVYRLIHLVYRLIHVWDSLLATPSSEQWPLNMQFLKKAVDGGRNVEVSRALLIV